MVLVHENGKTWEHNNSRHSECYFCHARLTSIVDGEVVLWVDHFEDSVLGNICMECIKKKINGEFKEA
jgi:hypothetical protein